MKDILIAVPTRGSVRWETITRLEQMRDSSRIIQPIHYQAGNVSAAETRNNIVEKCLEIGVKWLLMVDDDVVPPDNFLDQVFPMANEYGLIGACYPMVRDNMACFALFNDAEDELVEPRWPEQGINPVDVIGTGCVLIRCSVFNSLGSRPFRFSRSENGVFLGEDIMFCRDLRANGWKVGCWWNNFNAEHINTVHIAPLLDQIIEGRMARAHH